MTNENAAAKYDLVLERTFDAPIDAVWAAWTDEAQLAQWWGPKNFTSPVCRADARPGGKIYIEMHAPDGTVYPMSGIYEEVVKPGRIVFTSSPLDAQGRTLFEIRTTVTLAEVAGKTALRLEAKVLHMTSADAERYLNGMSMGWNQSLDRLGELVSGEESR